MVCWSDHCVATLAWPKSAWALIFTLKLDLATGSLIGYPVGIGAELITTFVAWLFAVHGVLFWQSEGRWYLVPAKALVTCRPVWIEGDLVAGRKSPLPGQSAPDRHQPRWATSTFSTSILHFIDTFVLIGLRVQKQKPPNTLRNWFARGDGGTPSSLLWANFLLKKTS